MPSNQYLIVGFLCLLFGITGGVGGYNLKSRMLGPDKPEPTTGLSALQVQSRLNASKVTATNCEPVQSVESASNLATVTPLSKDHVKRIKLLIKGIYSVASDQGIDLDLDTQTKTQTEFINVIDHSPELINPLLSVYQQMPQSDSKDLLRSLLATTGSSRIQSRAIDYLSSGQTQFQSDWLALLRDSGVHSAQTREQLFNIIPTLSQPQAMHDAIMAITPQIVSADERFAVLNQLNTYAHHNEDIVRTAAIETISRWADDSHAHVIEQALGDSSENVRYAAISAAYSSGIRSDYIESNLIDVMNNTNEDLQMRIHAYNALSNYSLQGQNYDQYYQFHQQLIALEQSGAAKG